MMDGLDALVVRSSPHPKNGGEKNAPVVHVSVFRENIINQSGDMLLGDRCGERTDTTVPLLRVLEGMMVVLIADRRADAVNVQHTDSHLKFLGTFYLPYRYCYHRFYVPRTDKLDKQGVHSYSRKKIQLLIDVLVVAK
jgi:hypothetical protein